MARPVIVVDIDGVLFDTPAYAVRRWNTLHGTDYSVEDIFDHNAKHDKQKFRHYHDAGEYKDDNGTFDDGFYGAQTDTANYLPVVGAKDALWRLKQEYDADVHALTARDKSNLEVATLRALNEHYGVGADKEQLIDELHFSGDPDFVGDKNAAKGKILKEVLHADIMVEDSIANAVSSLEWGVETVVLDQPYNRVGHEYPADKIAADWDALYHLISQSLEAQGYQKIELQKSE